MTPATIHTLKELSDGPVDQILKDVDRAQTVLTHTPYISNLIKQNPDVYEKIRKDGAEAAFSLALDKLAEAYRAIEDRDQVHRLLREVKAKGHLAIALADISRLWDLNRVTEAITQLAEKCCHLALWCAYSRAATKEWVQPKENLEETGLFAIAMGKMGAYELNYSSDVDLVVLFDPERFEAHSRSAKEAAVKITQDFANLMETRDEHGYVFRVDLRLRPDPSSNAIALSTQTALNYYERVGQNWERMAYIKGRVCAGDDIAGQAFFEEMQPYIWRRHLDYWAIGDIHAIKRQIHSTGGHEALDVKEFDVKLGRGGIREIEFFAQTQQLILGGRHAELRSRRTDEALDALVKLGAVSQENGEDLKRAYIFLRNVEHRIQMHNDEQSHILKDKADRRLEVAKLLGYGENLELFEQDLFAVRQFVHGVYSDLFAQEERLSGDSGNLVFTGVDDDPGTIQTLEAMGFSEPSKVIERIRNWHRGGLPATRAVRGQQLLTTLTPRLLKWMSDTGQPNTALTRFADFISGLRGGVQVFSLMLAEPKFSRDLISAMAYAPKLATDLARQPALLDGMLDHSFNAPLDQDSDEGVKQALEKAVFREDGFEDRINVARRFHREEALRIGYQVLRGQANAKDAGPAYTRLADAAISCMAQVALDEVERKFGEWPGKWVIGAFGKLGGRELSATSDLDIIVIYDPGTPPHPNDLAARFTQRLIAALSAPTEEGELYEVDMQLRPSGKAGPVAVKVSSFEKYYQGDAWTWEFMALSRLRIIAGDAELAQKIEMIAQRALQSRSTYEDLEKDILDMRCRLARDRKPFGVWDLKLAEGGLLDIEFVVQQAILQNADTKPEIVLSNTREAILELGGQEVLSLEEAEALEEAYSFQVDLQQALRIAVTGKFDVDQASIGLKKWLTQSVGESSFSEVTEKLKEVQKRVSDIRVEKIGALATEN
ncbi:bifunctional [glutamine synthetase] adenylyltransferase/[glutamine synthetase]-adenylyl-L-tyrosine phosphorylase [Hirschia maritima]|uniref:bifunctional [glutamine synthetase] adenylyltransferase/[glutamine synthetase]-adenylyl-L-tyrosine phosphorylase n=1 Tax=Hirschia maritima TaxID=1121961 RepID=UPI0003786946|nr:bifunctional [glutamine synthetase] adenylyltransferase/[glutamine synthetase]-adenylyl-L-tyrosine phosphorylase [Hirschia maritima]